MKPMMKPKHIARPYRWLLLLLTLLVITACASPAASAPSASSGAAATSSEATTVAEEATDSEGAAETSGEKIELRIGYQRGGAWTLVKANGTLEERLGPDVTVTWTLFTSGPPLLEAMNAGAIDIGSTGETPPIFAQAAGTPLLYIAYQEGSGAGSGVLVTGDSSVQSLQDLRGKKIAFAKASSSHLLLIKALEKEGLTYSDIEPVFLQPPEARAALEGGSVDAWVVWNPFLEAAIQELGAKIVVDGANVAPTKGYVLGRDEFVLQHPEIARVVVEEVAAAQRWAKDNLEEYAAILEKETGIAAAVWIGAFNREAPEYGFIDDAVITHQQGVADIFYSLELIPEPLNIVDSVWYGDED
jgi:sulfonate transport system substrate-binding protein